MRAANGREKTLSGTEARTTNNRMELMAAIQGLEALSRPLAVTLHTDSEYVFLGITSRLPGWRHDGWRTAKGKPVENVDLWTRLTTAAARHQVDWRWTRGHAGDPMNERVDRLATEAREREARR
jgi:ribonuclease HI